MYNGVSTAVDMQVIFAENPLCNRPRARVVASLDYERGSCSEARETARRALYRALRGDGGVVDPLRAWEQILWRARFAPELLRELRIHLPPRGRASRAPPPDSPLEQESERERAERKPNPP
ncbi:unnamed protein product [Urochloa humidicola]